MRPQPPCPIFLVGFMGVGKTAVGRELAALLGREFVDTDEQIAAASGAEVADIIRDQGESVFRRMELAWLERGTRPARSVVATGGGMMIQAEARQALRRMGLTVWLDAPLERIVTRVKSPAMRPLWPSYDKLALRQLFERRRACYALADICVGEQGGTVAAMARRVRDCIPKDFH